MMKNHKMLLYAGAVLMYSYMCVRICANADMSGLYEGIPFDAKVQYMLIQFILFSCYSLYIYTEFEQYVYEYGAYVLLREQSRTRIYLRLFAKCIGRILTIEAIKILFFFILMYWDKGRVTMENPLLFIRSIAVFVACYCFILLIQMILELFITGKTALIIVMSFVLINLGLSAVMQTNVPAVNLLLPVNYSMQTRIDTMNQVLSLNPLVIVAVFLLLIAGLYYISWKRFLKKDFLS